MEEIMKKYLMFTFILSLLFISGCQRAKTGEAYYSPSEEPAGTPEEPCNPQIELCNRDGKKVETLSEEPEASATPSPSASPECDPIACSAKSGWEVFERKWVKLVECKDIEKITKKWRYYHCENEKCVPYKWGLQKKYSDGETRNWPDGATCDPPGGVTEGYCKDGVCNEKTCKMYGSEGGMPCPATPSPARDCCPKGYQCCNDNQWNIELGARCCLNEPYQRCGIADFPHYEYENVCVELQCPDDTWHMCGDPDPKGYTGTGPSASEPNLGKSRCCRKEGYCSQKDMAENRCGDTCAEFSTISGCSMDKCPDPEEDYERRVGKYNSVCCKKGFEVPKLNERFGVWFCTREECPEGQHLCKGVFYNICCKDGEHCITDTEEPTCMPIGGKIDPYPWPSVAPEPK